jgi:glycosyltransferase involved in cell wall biosynthesis
VTSPGEPIELSIVMPCLNEARTLGTCIAKAQSSLEELQISGEIVVADNGSTDGSQELAERMGARVVAVPVRGYGAALQAGIAEARGRYVIMGDADDSYDFSALGPFVDAMRDGYDLVLGNRFRGGIEEGAMPPLHRWLGNPLLSRIGQEVYDVPIGDMYCGLRGFRKEAIDQLDLRFTGMEFALEMVVRARLAELRIAEVPTTLSPDGRDRAPHLRTWRDGWRSLRFFLLYSPRWLFMYPGVFLIVVGLVGMVALLPGPVDLGSVILDAHTLLYSAIALVLGYQAVLFSVLARSFAYWEGLLPESPRLTRMLDRIGVETGIMVGVGLILLGIIGSLVAVGKWAGDDLGRLNYSDTLRIVIPSCTLLMIGSQTLLGSFFLGVLGMKRRVRVMPDGEERPVTAQTEVAGAPRLSGRPE